MGYYRTLWKKGLELNIKTRMIYKLDFVVGILAMALSNVAAVAFFWIIFQHIPLLNGWAFEEVLFLSGMTMTIFGIWHVFFSGASFWHLDWMIRRGEFDRLMLQPIRPLIYMELTRIDDDGLGELITGLAVLWYASSAVGMTWSILNIITLLVFLLSGTLIVFSLILATTSASFWIVRGSALGEILYRLIDIIEYPLNIFNPVIMLFFTFVIPLAFVSYYPAQLLLEKGMTAGLAYAAPFVAVLSFAVANYLWKKGLKNYTSTGS